MEKTDIATLGYGSSVFNTHFVFNTLNIIQHYIIINDKKAALLSLNKFSKLFRQYLLLSQSGATSIDQEIKMIHLYLQLQVLRYTGKLTYQMICDENIQLSKEIPVVQLAVIIDDMTESLLKRGENEMHLCVGFREDTDVLLLTLEAGDLNERDHADTSTSQRGWQETGMYWREHIKRFNSSNQYQVSYSEEKVYSEIAPYKSYKWRVMIIIPTIALSR